MTRLMYDASSPPAVAPAGFDAVAFYVGGDTPHVWTDAEIARQHVRYRLPIWVRSIPAGLAEGTAEGNQAVNWARAHGQPKGTLIALDYETAENNVYLAAFDRVVVAAGYLTTLYGSLSTVEHNLKPSGGYWTADWTFVAHLDPGAEETQYSDKGGGGAYDLSEVADNAPLWDTQPAPTPTPTPPPKPRPTVYVTKAGDTLQAVATAFKESVAALATGNPTAQFAAGVALNVPVPVQPPGPPINVPTIKLVDIIDAAQRDPLAAQGVASHATEVTLVQLALVTKGFLSDADQSWGRGCFGSETVAAYAKWQGSLGYKGTDADGVPGALTLSKLGHDTGRFMVDSTGRPVPAPHPAGHAEQPIALSAVQYGHVSDASLSQTILPQVFQIMGISGQAALNWERGILTAAVRESSYDLNAINTTDLNAHGPTVADGHPEFCSRGVLQCIPPTFADHHESGTTDDIYDGVANVCAAMNYVMHNYGVSRDGHDLAAKVEQFDPNRAPRGY